MDATREIARSVKNAPPNLSGKTALLPILKTKFADAEHWDALAQKHLSHYVLPKWKTRASADALALWIERMDLPERAFLRMGAYRNLADAIALNPTWPLRALIGLALEVRDECET